MSADSHIRTRWKQQLPDLRADGELLNERHSLFFVDYLRLALLEYGGFPGFEGADALPAEIPRLRDGLLPF